jgi:acyl-CoA synthetase (AMP-forming)/AMP-acid ligase II
VTPLAKPERMAALLSDVGARVLFAASRVGPAIRQALAGAPSVEHVIWTETPPADGPPGACLPEVLAKPPARLDDPGLVDQDLFAVLYTSGSTGGPKGVMLTHRNLVNTTWSIATYLGNTPDDVVTCFLPLSHSYGLCQVLVGARVGHPVVLERSFAYPADVLRRVEQHRVTGFPAIPTVFAQLLPMAPFAGVDLSSIRYFTNAAAGLPAAQAQRLQALFPRAEVFLMYGQTECTRVCFLDPSRVLEKPTSVGRAIPNCEAWVVDERGQRVGPGVVGELVVRGANVMRGY